MNNDSNVSLITISSDPSTFILIAITIYIHTVELINILILVCS